MNTVSAPNYRSHRKIVDFFNDYITSFPEMLEPGVRAPAKLPVIAAGQIEGEYPAILWINGQRVADVADNTAAFIVDHLIGDSVIVDPSQCVVLFRSTKETSRNAGPLVDALRARGVAVYNPRSKKFIEAEEVQFLLGLLVLLIDPGGSYAASRIRGLVPAVDGWLAVGGALTIDDRVETSEIEHYMQESATNLVSMCREMAGESLGISLLEIAYRILSHEPFRGWREDPVRDMRLAKVTRLLESYHAVGWGMLKADAAGTGIAEGFRNVFYNQFVGYIISAGVDDEEEDDVIVPLGAVPVMTIHQAKGLEFPIVIAAQVGGSSNPSASQFIEAEFAPFRVDLYPRRTGTPTEMAVQDDIRLLYVAYSRAEYAMAIAGTRAQLGGNVAVPSRDVTQFRRSYRYYP